MQYVNELRDGDMISSVYLCKKKEVCKSKNGKSFYSLILQDKTGTVDAKIWDLTNAISHFEVMNFIHIDAQVVTFGNALQVNIRRVRVADEGEYSIDDYMPCSQKDIKIMYQDLCNMIQTVKNPYLKQLLDSFFVEDKTFVENFKRHSAAKSIHHGFIGGLLEHSLSVAKLCDFLAEQYPLINRDLLITAALFHDIGKVDELSDFPENDYTDEGQLVGHIVMGTVMISEKIKKISGFPAKLANELKHCILAHHGELEFGSPKKPALIEAVALAHADNMDAKLQTFTEVINGNKETSDWLGFNRLFDSNIRKTSDK